MILNCMIIDDDAMSRKMLHHFCQKTKLLNVVEVCESALMGLERLTPNIDLVFLDVEMPKFNGIDFLNHVPVLPQIIFTTTKKDYAYEAFEFQAIDYLKKPFNYPRFYKAVERAIEDARTKQLETHLLESQTTTLAQEEHATREIYIKDKGRMIRVEYKDILFFENVSDYVRVHTERGNHMIYKTLKSIDKKLPESLFHKVHRSYIINLKKIVDIEENSIVITNKLIPISKNLKPKLMEKLNVL